MSVHLCGLVWCCGLPWRVRNEDCTKAYSVGVVPGHAVQGEDPRKRERVEGK